MTAHDSIDELDIGVIGLAGRFPSARNVEEFWQNLKNGVECIRRLDDAELRAAGVDEASLSDPAYVKASSVLDDVDQFDADFFGLSPKEAQTMDPQSRIFLECAWEALENAGYNPQEHAGRTGIYSGASLNCYLLNNIHAALDTNIFTLSGSNMPSLLGNCNDFLATRVSYKLNLRGPSIDVQTACSSSLVAVHLARQSLLDDECDMALAGGVSIFLPQQVGYLFQEGLILSPDGHCRPFDADANGTVFGRGVGIVVLKRLKDAVADGDCVQAIIKGSAINNDGSGKVGYTAPSATGQAGVITEAIANAAVDPNTIGYIEAHGTGTTQGDPIELAGLSQAFRAVGGSEPCALGSVKSNIGHLDAASGIAGLIKIVLMVQHRQIPPTLHYKAPNAQIDFENSPFFVNSRLRDWRDNSHPRRAGVSSFGIGGTNAHVVIEEAPRYETLPSDLERPRHVLHLSAQTDGSLKKLASGYCDHLADNPGLSVADVCFTANTGRAHFEHRIAVPAQTTMQLCQELGAFAQNQDSLNARTSVDRRSDTPKLAFLFTGQGAQYAGMGRQLYDTQPTFRATLTRCDTLLQPHLERSLLSVLFAENESKSLIDETAYTQPALFALEYALAELWRSWGIAPDLLLGHSVGEYTAACLAGVFSLEDGLKLIAARGRLMQALPDNGSMAAVFRDEDSVLQTIAPYSGKLTVAAVNAPDSTVISGERHLVTEVLDRLDREGVVAQQLKVSHAFHSPLMNPILDEFEQVAESVRYSRPAMPLISNVTGELVREDQVSNAGYWRRHLREAVRFERGMKAADAEGCNTYMEIGPHPSLLSLGQMCISAADILWLPSLHREREDWSQLVDSLGDFYVRGGTIDYAGFDRDYSRRRVQLPTYAFERQRHWVDPVKPADKEKSVPGVETVEIAHPLLGTRLASPLKDIQFESHLNVDTPSFLTEHRLFGTAIFPATGYLEMALAAAKEAFGKTAQCLEDISIQEALIVPEQSNLTVQLVLSRSSGTSASMQLFSRQGGNAAPEWTLHASGTVRFDASSAAPQDVQPELEQIRRRCTETMSAELLYQRLKSVGLEYGLRFQGVTEVYLGDGETLVHVQPPALLESELQNYQLHPALLDACLQAIMVAAPGPNNGHDRDIYLPINFGRLHLPRHLDGEMWGHVAFKDKNPGTQTVVGDVSVFDSHGTVILQVDDLVLRRADEEMLKRAARARVGEWLYEVSWQVQAHSSQARPHEPPSFLPAAGEIYSKVEPRFGALSVEHGLEMYKEVGPRLDRLCSRYVLDALQRLGWQAAPGDRLSVQSLASELGVLDKHLKLFDRMFQMLADDGVIAGNGTEWVVKQMPDYESPVLTDWQSLADEFPGCEAELNMLGRCGPALADVLLDQSDPLQLLFPEGSVVDLEQLYRAAPVTRVYNSLVMESVEAALTRLPRDRIVRILEIGAGTGGTASWVIPKLNPAQTEYVFTDISHLFMAKAKEKFSDYSFVQYELLDISKDPARQGFDAGQFDLVLATNVLHATPDLKETMARVQRLLAPGGMLLMVEGVSAQRWVDLIFGLTEGWWLSTDTDLRNGYPLMSQDKWIRMLEELGYWDVAAIPGEARKSDLFEQAVLLARAPEQDKLIAPRQPTSVARRWLVCADRKGVGQSLATLLRERGDECDVVAAGTEYKVSADDHLHTIVAGQVDHYPLLLAELASLREPPLAGIVHLWSIGDATDDRLNIAELNESQTLGCESLLYLIQALANCADIRPPRLFVGTSAVQPVNLNASPNVKHAPIWGLAKVVTLEHPELRCVCIDLDAHAGGHDADAVLAELLNDGSEDQVALRQRDRFVARLVRSRSHSGSIEADPLTGVPIKLALTTRGSLNNLELVPCDRREPGPGELEIHIQATGLNFKDVLNTLGTYPGDPGELGIESTGQVVGVGEGVDGFAIGDEVVVVAPGGFGAFQTVSTDFVVAKPGQLTFAEAATIPVAFLTADYALNHFAKMARRERVLIHAAAGGVGMAAVQLALHADCEVFATAGSPEKRAVLKEMGVHHVMDSRSLAFAEDVMSLTEGRGVDIVLNSLAGEFIDATVSTLATNGRFVELGKSGWDQSAIAQHRPDADYHVIDLGEDMKKNPGQFMQMLSRLLEGFAANHFRPIVSKIFPLRDAASAFRYMAEARHIGKIVVLNEPDLQAAPNVASPDVTYLITGGLGGLGLLTARWLIEHGARHIVLLGRSRPGAVAAAAIAAMCESGAEIITKQADVTQQDELAAVFAEISKSMPPLKGIIHGAGVLDDGVLLQQDWQRFQTVMGPKIHGAWNLHQLSKNLQLDFFVLFSSAVTLLGSRGQANHVAANTFLDALAHRRRSQGLPALSIDWGAWGEIGAAAERDIIAYLAREGIGAIAPVQGILVLEQLVAEAMSRGLAAATQIGVLPVDWSTYLQHLGTPDTPPFFESIAAEISAENRLPQQADQFNGKTDVFERMIEEPAGRRRDILLEYLHNKAATGLGLAGDVRIDERKPLYDLGLDSLMAVELKTQIGSGLGLQHPLPATLLFDYPTLEKLAGYLLQNVFSEQFPAESEPTEQAESDRDEQIAEIAGLSDEEAESLLLEELEAVKR